MKQGFAFEPYEHGDVEVLHIDDHGPSGVHIFSSLAEDIQSFDPTDNAGTTTLIRLVVTPDQTAAAVRLHPNYAMSLLEACLGLSVRQ